MTGCEILVVASIGFIGFTFAEMWLTRKAQQ
jgi:hypothetical protein